AGNPTPSSSAVTSVAFVQTGWVGGNYSFLSPTLQSIGNNPGGWTNPASPSMCVLFSNNVVSDVTVSTITASFDHAELRSLWQCFQAEHTLG
ncbi:hypothetical protein, partial [Vibrio vulnificus]|uniref:hypothetical protein n=1 Tax=Vibrio vulnificus TaxID=672 RepID=UPI0039B4968B